MNELQVKEVEIFSKVCDNEKDLNLLKDDLEVLKKENKEEFSKVKENLLQKKFLISLIVGLFVGTIFVGIHGFSTMDNTINALFSFIAGIAFGSCVTHLAIDKRYSKKLDEIKKYYDDKDKTLDDLIEKQKNMHHTNQDIISEVRTITSPIREEENLLTNGSIDELVAYYNIDKDNKLIIEYLLLTIKCYNKADNIESKTFYGNCLQKLYDDNHSRKRTLQKM